MARPLEFDSPVTQKSVGLPDSLWKKIAKIAAEEDRSTNAVIRRLLMKALGKK